MKHLTLRWHSSDPELANLRKELFQNMQVSDGQSCTTMFMVFSVTYTICKGPKLDA